MFTRVVEVTAKAGKARDFANMVQEKALPILRKQPGFVDEILLVSNTDPNQVMALSFWKTQQDAERYHREQFPAIQEMLRPHIERGPDVKTFNVDASTSHKISRGKAA